MCIVCSNCGKKINDFVVVKYSIEYLEEYLADYFDFDISELRNSIIREPKLQTIKSICFNVIYKYSALSMERMGNRYGTHVHKISAGLKSVNKRSNHDYKFINKDLAGKLPEQIIDRKYN